MHFDSVKEHPVFEERQSSLVTKKSNLSNIVVFEPGTMLRQEERNSLVSRKVTREPTDTLNKLTSLMVRAGGSNEKF